jgi:hypothetical protein
MKYRVLIDSQGIPFHDYDKALNFQKKNGGQVYVRECQCVYQK